MLWIVDQNEQVNVNGGAIAFGHPLDKLKSLIRKNHLY